MGDPYIDAARREIERANKRAEKYAGPCEDCRWSKSVLGGMECTNPVVKVVAFNSDPMDARYIVDCEDQRSRSSIWGPVVCGPDGALFEPSRTFTEWLAGLFAKIDGTPKETPHAN